MAPSQYPSLNSGPSEQRLIVFFFCHTKKTLYINPLVVAKMFHSFIPSEPSKHTEDVIAAAEIMAVLKEDISQPSSSIPPYRIPAIEDEIVVLWGFKESETTKYFQGEIKKKGKGTLYNVEFLDDNKVVRCNLKESMYPHKWYYLNYPQ